MSMQKRFDHVYIYLLAVLVGVIAGIIAAAFHFVLDFFADHLFSLREQPLAFKLLLIAASGLLVCVSLWLVRRFAPEAHGSGIPQVEDILSGSATIRWWRIIPIKFLGSVCAIAPGLLLGREGSTSGGTEGC